MLNCAYSVRKESEKGQVMDDNIQDTLGTIQAQMQELDRIFLRVAFKGRLSRDSKFKVGQLLQDISKRITALPD